VIRLALRVRRADAELVLAELLELAPNGVEETEDGDVVEFAVYGAPGELPALPDLRAAAGPAFVDVRTDEIPDDWYDGWREFHRPAVIGDRLRVRPPWEAPAGELIDLVIDPGRAFGTGSHSTTRMCLELMLELDGRGSLADLGCGSGVLAIAGAKLGFKPVTALDSDRAAVAATRANARDNAVVLQSVERFDLRREPPPAARTIVANLTRPLLLTVAARLPEPPQALIAAGMLEAEVAEVAAAFGPALVERRRLSDRGWTALLLAAA
jgi:ribosomal protein L11 methyltransferase